MYIGLIQIYDNAGRAVTVSSFNEVVLSADVRGVKTFRVVDCLAWDTISEAERPTCISLIDANRTDWYVRHIDTILRVDPEPSTDYLPHFELDSSFIVHRDTFHPDHYALESVSFRHWYMVSPAGGRLRLVERDEITNLRDASFRVYDNNESSTYSLVLFVQPSINQSILIRQCNYKQTTTKKKKCVRLPEQSIAQQSWPP